MQKSDTKTPPAAPLQDPAAAAVADYAAKLDQLRTLLAEMLSPQLPRLDDPRHWDALQALRKLLGAPAGGPAGGHGLEWLGKNLAAPLQQQAERLTYAFGDLVYSTERAAEKIGLAGHPDLIAANDPRLAACLRGIAHHDGRSAICVIPARMRADHPAAETVRQIAGRATTPGPMHPDTCVILGAQGATWWRLCTAEALTREWDESRTRFLERKKRDDELRRQADEIARQTPEQREIERLKARVTALEAEKQEGQS